MVMTGRMEINHAGDWTNQLINVGHPIKLCILMLVVYHPITSLQPPHNPLFLLTWCLLHSPSSAVSCPLPSISLSLGCFILHHLAVIGVRTTMSPVVMVLTQIYGGG